MLRRGILLPDGLSHMDISDCDQSSSTETTWNWVWNDLDNYRSYHHLQCGLEPYVGYVSQTWQSERFDSKFFPASPILLAENRKIARVVKTAQESETA